VPATHTAGGAERAGAPAWAPRAGSRADVAAETARNQSLAEAAGSPGRGNTSQPSSTQPPARPQPLSSSAGAALPGAWDQTGWRHGRREEKQTTGQNRGSRRDRAHLGAGATAESAARPPRAIVAFVSYCYPPRPAAAQANKKETNNPQRPLSSLCPCRDQEEAPRAGRG